MIVKNQTKINMSCDDIKDAIIYYLYHKKNISGIFNVKFNLKRTDILHNFILDSAEIVVDLNETDEEAKIAY